MKTIDIHHLGRVDYAPAYAAMQAFNDARGAHTADQIWCLEHPPVYTLGLAGRRAHLHATGAIPVLQVDRGGQVTYHGPGQLVVYALLDLKRLGLGVRDYVHLLEQAVIATLAGLGLDAVRRDKAPGVYVDGRKIAALGVRVRGGCCYHGLALNVDMDLAPFRGIDPCGYPALEVTQLSDYGVQLDTRAAAARLLPELITRLGFDRGREAAGTPPQLAAALRSVA